MKKKVVLTGILRVAAVGLLSVSAYFAYESVTAPASLFELETGRGARTMTSLDHYLAVLSFVAAVGLLALIRKDWT